MKISVIAAAFGLLVSTVSASATTYTTVQESAAGTARTTVDVTAHCPAGYTPVGGGYDMAGLVDARVVYNGVYLGTPSETLYATNWYLPAVAVTISRPSDAGDGWRVAGYVNKDVQLYAWARCASLN